MNTTETPVVNLMKEFPQFTYRQGNGDEFQPATGKGWNNLLRQMMTEFVKIGGDIHIDDIQEDAGQLLVLMSPEADECFDIEEKYMEKSLHICKQCGSEGDREQTGYASAVGLCRVCMQSVKVPQFKKKKKKKNAIT